MNFLAWVRSAQRFGACNKGNFGVIAAVMAMPLVTVIGLSLDYSRLSSAESKLQAAVDSAAFAAVASGEPVHVMQQIVEDFVAANFDEYPAHVKTVVETNRILVTAVADVPLPVLAAAGRSEQRVGAQATVHSARPLRGGAVASGERAPDSVALPKGVKRELAEIRKRYREALRKLPARERQRLEAEIERYLDELERQALAQVRLAE